jgi:uncharacterized membrane protein
MRQVNVAEGIEATGLALDVAGVAVIAAGTLVAAARSVLPGAGHGYTAFRQNLGRTILLGLELLVAADIVRTVAIEPTLESVAVLALIVLIRTFLSITLEVELEGRWPWQREQKRPDPTAAE